MTLTVKSIGCQLMDCKGYWIQHDYIERDGVGDARINFLLCIGQSERSVYPTIIA